MTGLAIAAALAGVVAAGGCSAAGEKPTDRPIGRNQENRAMDDAPTASRPAPPRVLPIEHQGTRYQQDFHAFHHGGTQRGGYLVAVDTKTGARLWMLKVYPVADESAAGVETPGIYFRSMQMAPGGNELEIENEVGGRYRVDLRQRSSTWISGPESSRP